MSTDGSAKTYGRRVMMRPNVIPDEFRRLKTSYQKDLIEGFADMPDETAPFTCKFCDAVTLSKSPAPRQRRPDSDQVLPAITEADLVALGITLNDEVREALR